MPKEPFKERMRRQREEEILSEAGFIVGEHGYDALTMDMLAEAVGVAKPTLYQHFKSKEELVTQLLLRKMELLEEHLLKPHPGTAGERLVEVMRLLLEARHSPRSPLAPFEPELITTLIHTHPDIRELKARVNIQLEKLIDEGKVRGEITTDLPTPMIIGWMYCSTNIFRVSYPESWKEQFDENIDRFTRTFVHAITP